MTDAKQTPLTDLLRRAPRDMSILHESPDQQGTMSTAVGRMMHDAADEIERLRDFADLWYFIMDEAPRDFERIVAEYQPKAWLEQAAKLRRAKKEQR